MKRIPVVILSLVLLCLGIQSQTAMSGPEEIRKSDGDWLKAVQSKDVAKVLSFYRDDAAWLLRDTPPIKGKQGIQSVWAGFFGRPSSWIQWDPETADVSISISGDLGYSAGTYEMRYLDQEGKTVVQKGSYVTIWKKDINGVWKIAIDISN